VPEPFFVLDFYTGVVNNKMIFYAHNTVDGYEPYVSDGTPAGTFMLANINPAALGNSSPSVSQNAQFRFNSKHCFFIANNGTSHALWRTDGTIAGTIQLTADSLNVQSGVSGGSYTDIDEDGLWLIQYNSMGSGNNEKLYKSGGNPSDTYLADSNLSYAQNIKIYQKALWMASRDKGSVANVEPWRSEGTPANTSRAFEIAPGTASSNPFGFFVKNNKLYFFATTSGSVMNLYQYGSAAPDFTFNGSVAGANWNDGGNWNSNEVPGIADTANIPAGAEVVISGAPAKAARLVMGNGAKIHLTNGSDSLIISHSLQNAGSNGFTGNGTLVFKTNTSQPTIITGGFTAAKIAFLGNALLPSDLILIKP
jgi:ELWxxDGT repeat protein